MTSATRVLALLLVALCSIASVEGSYRFGTLTWRAVPDKANTVEFELTTAWRRNFQWVYVKQMNAGARALTDAPIVGDVLRVTGLYDKSGFSDQDGTQAIVGGKSEIMFYPGDGTSKYYVDMTVTSYSAAENWIMCTTLITHTYATPFKGKLQDIYPAGFTYQAGSASDLAKNQPFSHIPWTAYFEGCCRLPSLPSSGGNSNKPYRLETLVDVTDRSNAPSSRTMPVVTVPRWDISMGGTAPEFYVVAKDQYEPSSDVPQRISGGITNYEIAPGDRPAPLKYSVATAADLGLPASHYTPYSGLTIDAMGKASFSADVDGSYQVAVLVFSNGTKTIVDFMVNAVTPGADMPVAVGSDPLMEKVNGWVGYKVGAPMLLNLVVNDPNPNKLVLNYVFSGLRVASSSLAGNGGVVYSPLELNHQGLPDGASLYSTADNAIVDIKITYDNPFVAHRPQHDAAVSKASREYVNAPGAMELWNMGYRPINMTGSSGLNPSALGDTLFKQAFNLNSGTGGAAVYMWVLRASNQAAVTEVQVSTSAQQEADLLAAGYTKVPEDLNKDSSSMVSIYLWMKKGSGPAIVDIKLIDVSVEGQCCAAAQRTQFTGNDVGVACSNCTGGYHLVPANLNFGASNSKLFMYYKRSPVGTVSKQLSWVPQRAGHYVMCYSGQQADTAARLSSTQRCLDLNIRNDPAPAFQTLSPLSTYMGKVLEFDVQYIDIQHPDEILSISMDTTGLTLAGAEFTGHPIYTVTDVGVAGVERQTSVTVRWFPDATYGGFSGDVCFNAADSGGDHRVANVVKGCVVISVERCKWFVQTEDTLVQVAARFDTNWLQVWHFNPTILHPDNALPPGLVIHTGHLYNIEPSDSLAALADRFGTSISKIRANNWDMGGMPDSGLRLDQTICVIPSSCATAAHVQRI